MATVLSRGGARHDVLAVTIPIVPMPGGYITNGQRSNARGRARIEAMGAATGKAPEAIVSLSEEWATKLTSVTVTFLRFWRDEEDPS